MKELGKEFAVQLDIKRNEQKDPDFLFSDRWKKCCDFGLFQILDTLQTGGGPRWKEILSFMYGLGLGSNTIGILFSINVQLWACISPIKEFCSSPLQKDILDNLCTGKWIGAHAISEQRAGSNVFELDTEYIRTPEGYVISGQKNYVTNAPYADIFLVYAREKGSTGFNRTSCFLIHKDLPGVHVGNVIPKMGLDYSPMASLYLNKCFVEPACLLGRENQGFFIFNHVMTYERPLLLSFQVGLMENQLQKNIQFCKERKQGGEAIIKYQSVSNRLADMKVNVEISKLLISNIVEKLESQKLETQAASIAKLFISEKLVENCMMAIKNYGTLGYLQECDLQQNLKDSLGSFFYSGTSDIQRNIISSYL